MCGSTSGQKNAAASAASSAQTAQNQASSIFGNDQQSYKDLMSTFAPTVAAGPGQQGYSSQELGNLNSGAITQTGQEYKNEKAALGNSEAAVGGGTSVLPSGATVGADVYLAENAGNQTASELSGITQAGYAQGEKNYDTAVQGELAAPGVFSTATNATNATTGANSANSTSQNDVAQSNESPWTAALGAAGAVGGAASGAAINKFG